MTTATKETLEAAVETAKKNLRAAELEYDKGGLNPNREQILGRATAQDALDAAKRKLSDWQDEQLTDDEG